MSNELTTVPTFNFSQGEFAEDNFELPITVRYYNTNLIELEQEGKSIMLRIENVQKLASMIKKYNHNAQIKLK